MAKFRWIEGLPPQGTRVSQVYGFLFSNDGRVLLRTEREKYSLPGGRPEPFDVDYSAVLRREAKEEVNAEIGEPVLLGYQEVDEEDGTTPYAQLRMVATLRRLGPREPDPDTGRTYGRILADWSTCARLLAWGDVGTKQARFAHETAVRDLAVISSAPSKIDEV